MQAGDAIESQYPSLPAEATMEMPAAAALLAAAVIDGEALSQVAQYWPPPKLVLITRIGYLGLSFLWLTHQSHDEMIAELSALPLEPLVILSAYNFAAYATPPI